MGAGRLGLLANTAMPEMVSVRAAMIESNFNYSRKQILVCSIGFDLLEAELILLKALKNYKLEHLDVRNRQSNEAVNSPTIPGFEVPPMGFDMLLP